MRFAWLLSFIVFTSGAGAQINPHTQINWPPACQTAGSTYTDFPVPTCITATGTGLPVANPQYTGALIGPTITSSVNSQLNVQAPPYGAVGDCVTDDATAINAACTQAKTMTHGGWVSNAEVLFPKPAGGCYLVSTLTACTGVSFKGQPGGLGSTSGYGAGVIIRGKPGQDIIHGVDPTQTTSPSPLPYWNMEDISFQLDDSIDASASFPHRWPGRWASDGAMTSGSATLTSTRIEFTCSDVGQPVRVKGAGAAGADLITTIASIPSCGGDQFKIVATLAASASTTVSSAQTYVSVDNIPATQTIGNCIMGFDNYDGNSAHWTGGQSGGSYNVFRNVVFSSLSGTPQNNSCGMFAQEANFYGLTVDHMNVVRLVYGIVQTAPELSSQMGSAMGDYQQWSHMNNQSTYPWISYNGGIEGFSGWQLGTSFGPVISALRTSDEFIPSGWDISIPEFEINTGNIGMILKGTGHLLREVELSAGSGSAAYIDATGMSCESCIAFGTLNVNGSFNNMIVGPLDTLAVVDNGVGNLIGGQNYFNPIGGKVPSRVMTVSPIASRTAGYAGYQSADFLNKGLSSTPYLNQQDLLFFPDDWVTPSTAQVVISDTASLSGKYQKVTGNTYVQGFSYFDFKTGGNVKIASGPSGGVVPAGPVTFYLNSKCPVLTSYFFNLQINAVSRFYGSLPCSTTYTTQSFSLDLSPYAGQNIVFGFQDNGAAEIDNAWMAIVPAATSGGFPLATNTKDKIAVNPSGVASLLSPVIDEYNVALHGGFDTTGATDVSAATATLLTSGITEPIYFPAGIYNFNSGMLANCTNSTCSGLVIRGAGRGKTIFQSSCSNGINWWINSTATSGSYWFGPKISGISFKDTSGTGACSAGLRLTQMANFHIEDTEYDNFLGKYYHTGNITVTNGSTTVTGSGTTFTSAMLQQTNQAGTIAQLLLHVNGRPQFICAYVSATQLTLCDNWQGSTTTTTAANQWDLGIGGTGLLFDGGTNYIQYGYVLGTWSSGTLNSIGSVPEQIGSSQGTSRIWIIGGFLNPLRFQDSKCAAFGNFTDTITWHIACNNAAWGGFWEDSHDNEIADKIEQDNGSTPVYTCNGGVASNTCTVGHEFTAGSSGRSYGNSLHDDVVYNYGNALYVASTSASFLSVTNPKWMNSGGASANVNDFNFMGTTGCPANGSGNHATIIAWNCIHFTSAVGVN